MLRCLLLFYLIEIHNTSNNSKANELIVERNLHARMPTLVEVL